MNTPPVQTFYFQELSELTGIKPYVIRFWETEFTEINPTILSTGEKVYSPGDVEILLKIKKFLFEDKLTIHQAKLSLKNLHHYEEQELTTNLLINKNKLILEEALVQIQNLKSRYHW